MSLTRIIGRALLSSVFIRNGAENLRHPDPIIKATQGAEIPMPELAVKLNSGLIIAAGTLMALGVEPRIMSTTLAASLIPTTVIGHPFWDRTGQERERQQMHFLKNLALFGALLYISGQE